jgi:uncharacterized protein DUF6881
MRARLKRGWSRTYPELTAGNVYRVVGIEADDLRIVSDVGEPVLFLASAFELVDSSRPTDWIEERGEDGELYAYPGDLREPRCFFESYFDHDARVRSRFHDHLQRLCHAEAAANAYPPNVFMRVRWHHSSVEHPVMLYSELDETRWEVRKVDLFADGRLSYADARTSTGDTRLGEAAVPLLEEIAASSELEPAEIGRAEFEEIWERALAAEQIVR